MAYCRHDAALSRPTKDGSTRRAHFLVAAARGSVTARAALVAPRYPQALTYLHDYAREVHGRSGFGMHGMNPLTYTTLADWSRLKDVTLAPHEVDALLALDAAMFPPSEDEADG